MRRPRCAGGVIVLAGLLAGGCLPQRDAEHAAGWLTRVRGWTAPADGLFVQTALVDQPAPDPFLTHELWAEPTAVNPLTAEQSALLELNGMRVRVTAGIPPARLQAMLTSEDAALDPRGKTLKPGQTRVVPVNGPLDRATFAVRRELKADPDKIDATGVECGLAVTARADGGRVVVRCEPRVQYGERQQFLNPTADGSGFTRQERKPSDAYPTLGWEVTVGPGDYLIVGPTADPDGTLGEGFFLSATRDQVRQRVLVVRAGKLADAPTAPGSDAPRPLRPTTAAAAAQAGGRPTARGTGE